MTSVYQPIIVNFMNSPSFLYLLIRERQIADTITQVLGERVKWESVQMDFDTLFRWEATNPVPSTLNPHALALRFELMPEADLELRASGTYFPSAAAFVAMVVQEWLADVWSIRKFVDVVELLGARSQVAAALVAEFPVDSSFSNWPQSARLLHPEEWNA